MLRLGSFQASQSYTTNGMGGAAMHRLRYHDCGHGEQSSIGREIARILGVIIGAAMKLGNSHVDTKNLA